MKEKIKVDVVSDIVCPWCIIGYKRMQKAIEELEIQHKIILKWQPFELNSTMPIEGENVLEHIKRKYGSSIEDAKRSQENMTELGAELGFKFDYFDEMKIVNTIDAHILLEYAKEYNLQTALNVRFVTAFFSERKDISNREVLFQEITNIGLNVNEAKMRLENKANKERIKKQIQFWQSRGISSVPTVVFNNSSAVTGAQSTDVYKQIFMQLLNE
ncbi:DsbA family oxidoreductase [Lutibacter sp.]|uniref:DsbA family oxidoreductase n=1 Tax=Lutibacter sp. TaxID=1925666 RepID=UPI003566339D